MSPLILCHYKWNSWPGWTFPPLRLAFSCIIPFDAEAAFHYFCPDWDFANSCPIAGPVNEQFTINIIVNTIIKQVQGFWPALEILSKINHWRFVVSQELIIVVRFKFKFAVIINEEEATKPSTALSPARKGVTWRFICFSRFINFAHSTLSERHFSKYNCRWRCCTLSRNFASKDDGRSASSRGVHLG